MNRDTAGLIRRPYEQVVDDLLTAMAGGVVNERVVFDVGGDRYPLARPARDVRSVTGVVALAPYGFAPAVDFVFDPARNELVWLPGGTRPDDGTTFFVDYFVPDSASPLTDLNVGSVARTVAEAFARETAALYKALDEAYLAGFVDTATGTSLDLVVSVLDVRRKTGDLAQGSVAFFRDPGVDGVIMVPQASVLRTTKGTAEFETVEPRLLQQGQARIDVPVRASAAFPAEAGVVGGGEITVLVQALAGIARVTNLDPTTLGGPDETDEQLRARAKVALRTAGRATLGALSGAIAAQRAALVGAWDPDGAPGRVALLVDATPSQLPAVRAAVHENRAAGVVATVLGRYVYVTPRVVGFVDPALTPAGRERAALDVVAAVQAYVDTLDAGVRLAGEDLLAGVATVQDVIGARVVELVAATSDVTGSTPPTAGGGATGAAVPAGIVVSPHLVVGPGGATATDDDLEAGTFWVLTPAEGDAWWITLEMTAGDVQLLTAGA